MGVLVTGGAGYIGSHMVLALVDCGEDVAVLDDLSTGHDFAVAPAAAFYHGDIGDRGLVERIIDEHRVDAFVHFAGSVVVPESVRDPLKYYLNNTAKTRNLIEVAVSRSVRSFVFSSTAAVYGNPHHPLIDESQPTAPISPYGWSKLMSEIMLKHASEAHGLAFAALRYFNVAGADSAGRTGQSTPFATHLIKVACQAALRDRPALQVYGADYPTADGTCVRDYIHVTDLVQAHLLALAHLRASGTSLVLNCGYGRGSSVLEVIKAVEEVSGTKLSVEVVERRDGDPAALIADTRQLQAKLDWKPRYDDLRLIVSDALRWERALKRRNSLSG